MKSTKRFANHIEHFLVLASAITVCLSISDFVSLVGIPMGITSSATKLKIWEITTAIKKCLRKRKS